ncbi:hypothetical protein [Caldifermentibacillus hisashii]|nr:hypothetical protein [Caldifermentibacillus hisashii]
MHVEYNDPFFRIGLYLTYEELKQYIPAGTSFNGICLYLTYEELKLSTV